METANLSGKENEREEQEEAWKGTQTMMNSAKMKGKADEKEEEKALSMWDCGSPLYDSHELASLHHLIDRHLMAFPSLHGSKPIITHHDVDSVVAQSIGSPEKSKESFSLSKFLVKMRRKRKDNKESRKKNKGMRRSLAGFVVDLLCCGGNKKST